MLLKCRSLGIPAAELRAYTHPSYYLGSCMPPQRGPPLWTLYNNNSSRGFGIEHARSSWVKFMSTTTMPWPPWVYWGCLYGIRWPWKGSVRVCSTNPCKDEEKERLTTKNADDMWTNGCRREKGRKKIKLGTLKTWKKRWKGYYDNMVEDEKQ